jgi:hypothetical protein
VQNPFDDATYPPPPRPAARWPVSPARSLGKRLSHPADRDRLGPVDRQTSPDPQNRGADAGLSAQARGPGATRHRKTPHLPPDPGPDVDHRRPDLGGAGPDAGQLHRRRVRLRGGAHDPETAAGATQEESLGPIRKTLRANCGPAAADRIQSYLYAGKCRKG